MINHREYVETGLYNGVRFRFKQVQATMTDKEIVNGLFMIAGTTLTIKTPSESVMKDIKPNDIIKLRGKEWRVNGVQTTTYITENMTRPRYIYFLGLKGIL